MIRRPYDISGLNRSIDDQIAEQLALENVPNPGATGPTLNGLPFVEDQEAAQHRFTGHVGTTEADAGGDIIDVNAVPSMARQSVDNPTDLLNPYLDDDSAAPNVRPQFANQPASNPFQTTADEDKDLERAARADRRSKIAQGVLGALGGIMSIAGAGGMAGAAGAGLTRGIQQLPTNREEQLRGRIEQRQARDLRRQQYEQQRQQYADSRADRQAQYDARARLADSSIDLNRARAEQARLQAQRMQSDWDSLRGNQAASVNWLRNLASMYDPNSNELIRNIMTGTEPNGVLTGASQEQLDAYARQLTTLASSGQVAGRAAIGHGTGRGASSASPLAARPLDSAPELGDLSPQERIIVQDAAARNVDTAAALEAFRGATPANRTGIYEAASARTSNRSAGRFVLSPGLSQTEWQNDHEPRLDRAAATRRSVRDVASRIQSLVSRHGAASVRLALNGDPRVSAVMGQDLSQLRAAVGRAVAAYRLQMTGQGGSAAEDARLMNNLNMGSIAQDPSATAASLNEMGDEQLRAARNATPPDYVAEWERRNRENRDRARSASSREGSR